MKLAILFVALICGASAAAAVQSPLAKRPLESVSAFNDMTMSDHIEQFILNQRPNFRCGAPESGIPVLEPFRIDEANMFVESMPPMSDVNFTMRDADVIGISTFNFRSFNFRIAQMRMDFDMYIEQLVIDGFHTTSGRMLTGIITIPIEGDGPFRLVMHNVRLIGGAQLRTIAGGFMHMESMTMAMDVERADANILGFGALSGTISAIVGAVTPNLVANNADLINNLIGALLPGINENLLNQWTLFDMVNAMAEANQNPQPPRC